MSISVLRRTDTSIVRHSWAGQPSVINGIAFVLLVVLTCCILWYSLYHNTRRHCAAARETRYYSDKIPFTIRQLNSTTYLIRENDHFDEYPHIYVKKCTQTNSNGQEVSVLVVNDTGVGTSTRNRTPKSQEWNIKTIIDHHLNPNNSIPYLIILSHCHYDHILGLNHLLHPTHDAKTPQHNPTILSSSHSRSFTTPRHNLKKHSLCNALNLPCPLYSTSIWANHHQHITYTHPSSGNTMTLPLLTLHTPGHTPDSLSWYDAEERVLYTGDSFYEQESDDSRAAPWGREKASPILFPKEGDVVEWWRSVGEMVRFVGERNAEGVGRRVVLAAGHVTAGRDAMDCLLGVRGFVAKVLRDEVGFEELPLKRGERFGLWSEHGSAFSLGAPFRVIEEARKAIPEVEWRNDV